MTNRFLTRPTFDLSARHLDHYFNFSGEQYSKYCSHLNRKLLELEHRTSFQQSLKSEPADNARAPDSREAHVPNPERPSFDESRFELDFEIDARWI